jgi:shikimate dehydrogenase
MTRLFTFIGVTTPQSSMVRVFPVWRDLLQLGDDVELLGVDLPLHAPAERYRETVISIRDDAQNLGALVTTHKLDLFAAARDLFGEIDRYAETCAEVSCIAKRDGRLVGKATDPISAGRSLQAIIPEGSYRGRQAEVLCLGAGGAGTALAVCLLSLRAPGDRPAVFHVVDVDEQRLANVQRVARETGFADALHAIETHSAQENDDLVGSLPPGSLVINATGMGKDTPGSPLTEDVLFPTNGIVWELNYRGELMFLHQAIAQGEARSLRIEDGWRYFVNGWAVVIEGVFDRAITDDELVALSDAAAFARPASPLTVR